MAPSTLESMMSPAEYRPRTPSSHARRRGRAGAGLLALVAIACAARAAHAQATPGPQPDASQGESLRALSSSGSTMGLDPTAPQTAALPGGMTPAFGQKSLSSQDWRFDFHGFLTAPLNAGIGTRAQPAMAGQSTTVLHA